MAQQTLEQIRKVRLEKANKLRELGINPYPSKVDGSPKPVSEALASEGNEVGVAGRVMAWREHGNVIFADLKDESGQIQLWFQKNSLGEDIKILRYYDIGDFVYVKGKVVKTSAGEISIDVSKFQLLAKSIRPLPSLWHGFKDVEEKYRKRYLDLLLNEGVIERFKKRSILVREVRNYLDSLNFYEVETPTLQALYGGANAKPFKTHHNALDYDFYLRIADELYLKRLLVGGLERVYEICKDFRNEGLDQTHSPEFTMIEYYEAYADYHRVMDVTEGLFKHLAEKLYGKMELQVEDKKIDISKKWPRIEMTEAIKKYLSLEVEKLNDEELKEYCNKEKIETMGGETRGQLIFTIFEHKVTDNLIEPTWIIDYPKDVSPLSKDHPTKEGWVERFEGYIGGKEICDGWSELNDPVVQRNRFESDVKMARQDKEEAQQVDEDFIEAMEYGMPPIGGIGIGIDRLTMFFTNTWSIKEVILFPTLKPETRVDLGTPKIKAELKASTLKTESMSGHNKLPDLGVSYKKAKELVDRYNTNKITKLHVIESEAIMRALATRLGGEEEKWGIIGLLHDLDWDQTKNDTSKHCVLTAELLKKEGGSDFLIETIQSHGYGEGWGEDKFYGPKEFREKKRTTTIQHALAAAETLTGLIVATALIQPDKKLKNVSFNSLRKKYKNLKFAANCNRNIMKEHEELGLTLDEFLKIGLESLQDISDQLGL